MPTTARNYVKEVRDRLILLLERHPATNTALKAGNRSRRSDTSPRGLAHKPEGRQPADFPQLKISTGERTDTAFSNPETFAHEDDDPDADYPADITQNYEAVVIHEDLNEDRANAFDLEVAVAFRAGRRRLIDPATPASALGFVLFWGPLTARRAEEQSEETQNVRRLVTRMTIPVRMQFDEPELTIIT